MSDKKQPPRISPAQAAAAYRDYDRRQTARLYALCTVWAPTIYASKRKIAAWKRERGISE